MVYDAVELSDVEGDMMDMAIMLGDEHGNRGEAVGAVASDQEGVLFDDVFPRYLVRRALYVYIRIDVLLSFKL